VRRAAIALACVASTLLASAAPATAAQSFTGDQLDDVPVSRLDMRSVNVYDAAETIRFVITLEGEARQWVADVDGGIELAIVADGTPFFVEMFFDPDAGAVVGVVVDGDGRAVGPAATVFDQYGFVEVAVRRATIGDPASFTWAASSAEDTDHDGTIAPDEFDAVPDQGTVTHTPTTPGAAADVHRLAGGDRIATAVAISGDSFDGGTAGAVVLARADSFADALGGVPLAVASNGPVLLTPPDGLDVRTRTELRRVLGADAGKTVHILGGPAALSPAVEAAVRADGYQVVRYAGADRFDTSVRIAHDGLHDPEQFLLTTGLDFPDALAAGAAAAHGGGAVLLSNGIEMPESVAIYLDDHPEAGLIAVGGPARFAAYPFADEEIFGITRYETAKLVADRFFVGPEVIGVASGRNYPDALGGGVHAAALGGPLLLAETPNLTAPTWAYLFAHRDTPVTAFVYGGDRVVVESAFLGVVGAVDQYA
jgi:putative cell wall-binding protein